MPTVSANVVLAAPMDKVWATVGDLNAQPEWNTVHVAFPNGLPAEVAPEAEFTQTVKNMGGNNDLQWTVAAFEAERLLELRGKAPMGVTVRMRYEIAEAPGGTRVVVENEFEGAMIKLMAGKLKSAAQADLDASLEKLKAIFAG